MCHLFFFAMKTESIIFSFVSLFFGFRGAYSEWIHCDKTVVLRNY